MGFKCFVPSCTSGYKSNLCKVSLFKAPKDETRFNAWKKAIPRADKELQPNSYVCALHFPYDMILTTFNIGEMNGVEHILQRARVCLRLDAIPCIFPNLPAYLTKVPLKRKSPRKQNLIDRPLPEQTSTSKIDDYSETLNHDMPSGNCNNILAEMNNNYTQDSEDTNMTSTIPCKGVNVPEFDKNVKVGILFSSKCFQNLHIPIGSDKNVSVPVYLQICKSCLQLKKEMLCAKMSRVKYLQILRNQKRKIFRRNVKLKKIKCNFHDFEHNFISSLPFRQQLVIRHFIKTNKTKSNKITYDKKWLLECVIMKMKSPKLYRHLRSNKILPLPTLNLLNRRLKNIRSGFGICPQKMEAIKLKVETMDEYMRHGNLVMDEMKLRESLNLSKATSEVTGLLDLGDFTTSSQVSSASDHVLILMFQPYADNSKQVIGVYASRGNCDGVTLSKVVLNAIICCENSGLRIDGITCEGSSWNRKMFLNLGGGHQQNKQVTYKVMHPCDSTRDLHFFSDFPHLIKCLRNILLKDKVFEVFDELSGYKSINIQEPDICDAELDKDFIKEEHSIEASFDDSKFLDDLSVDYSPIAIKEADTWPSNDGKVENHIVKQENFIEASLDDSKPILNISRKIHLKPKEEKTVSIVTTGGISQDCIYVECLPIKYGNYYIQSSEGGYQKYYRDNFDWKITKQFTRRICTVSLSKLKLGDFRCNKCYNLFYSIRAKKSHLCKCNLTGDVSKDASFIETLKIFNCLQCNKSYRHKSHLNRHVFSVHEKIQDKNCSQCSSKFSHNYELKDHILCVHVKNKIYKCLKCPDSFCCKRHLTKHVTRVHKKLKPHQCPRCPMSFQNNYELYSHTSSVHLKLKPFQCADCLKGFSRKTVLSKHIASVHLNLRDYACSECSSTFTRKDCLSSHIKIQHSIKKCSQSVS